MELNKITKGMSNAADAIDQNFTAVAGNIDFADITSGFSLDSGVTNFCAYKFGRVAFLRFDYQPTGTGFNKNVVTTTLYRPYLRTAVTVGTSHSPLDSARGISSLFLTTGELRVVVPEVPGNPMLFTCMYLI